MLSGHAFAEMKLEILGRALDGKLQSHERYELLGEALVAIAVERGRVPNSQVCAEHVRELVGKRPHESRIRLEGAIVAPDERVVSEKDVIDRLDVQPPIATTGCHGLEPRAEVIESPERLAIEEHIPG
jgi:hypothetical protein